MLEKSNDLPRGLEAQMAFPDDLQYQHIHPIC